MATLEKELPTYAFPHELDKIEILGKGKCAVVIKIGGAVCFSSSLYFDEDNLIHLYNVADIIRSYANQGLNRLEIHLDNVLVNYCNIIPCAVDLDTTAVKFCPNHYLTRCGEEKSTTLESEEYLSYYASEGKYIEQIIAVYTDGGRMKSKELPPIQHEFAGFYEQKYKVADIAAQVDGHLIGFAVHLGNRTMKFMIREALPSAERLRFRNCFSVWETLSFSEVQTKLQTQYDNMLVNGKIKPYKVEQHHDYKYISDYIISDETDVFEDLAAAKEVVRERDNAPLTVTGCDFTRSANFYNPVVCQLTLRESNRVPLAKTTKRVKTFDDTFDKTFE